MAGADVRLVDGAAVVAPALAQPRAGGVGGREVAPAAGPHAFAVVLASAVGEAAVALGELIGPVLRGGGAVRVPAQRSHAHLRAGVIMNAEKSRAVAHLGPKAAAPLNRRLHGIRHRRRIAATVTPAIVPVTTTAAADRDVLLRVVRRLILLDDLPAEFEKPRLPRKGNDLDPPAIRRQLAVIFRPAAGGHVVQRHGLPGVVFDAQFHPHTLVDLSLRSVVVVQAGIPVHAVRVEIILRLSVLVFLLVLGESGGREQRGRAEQREDSGEEAVFHGGIVPDGAGPVKSVLRAFFPPPPPVRKIIARAVPRC